MPSAYEAMLAARGPGELLVREALIWDAFSSRWGTRDLLNLGQPSCCGQFFVRTERRDAAELGIRSGLTEVEREHRLDA